jgi:hypothetical protein
VVMYGMVISFLKLLVAMSGCLEPGVCLHSPALRCSR